MPHDINGNKISKGDIVTVEFEVTDVTSEGEELCNLIVKTVQPMYPNYNKTFVSLNAKQVSLLK